ncbi:type I-E CRISPR-associated protein Cas5/CasD [Desulfocurvus sp. DL9XJH121]
MAEHLVFTLYGPLQAWGSVAVGEIRPCAGHPTRSGVLGLLAAALGIRRGEGERLQALSDAYAVAVRVDDPGERFRDYHTVQTPQEKAKRAFHCRRDELGTKLAPDETPNTLLSRRDYLTDARFTVCLRPTASGAPHSLRELHDALLRPRLTPYLGRKSCPTALPFLPQIIDAADALAALDVYAPDVLAPLAAALRPDRRKARGNAGDVFCDKGMCGAESSEQRMVRDVLDDHARRAFGIRQEWRYPAPSGQGGE